MKFVTIRDMLQNDLGGVQFQGSLHPGPFSPVGKNRQLRPKAATNKDLKHFDNITSLKFAAKIRGWCQNIKRRWKKDEKPLPRLGFRAQDTFRSAGICLANCISCNFA